MDLCEIIDNNKNFSKKDIDDINNNYKDIGWFNCMGFALGDYDWLDLDAFVTPADDWEYIHRNNEDENYSNIFKGNFRENQDFMEYMEDIAEDCADEVDRCYVNCRRVSSIDDLLPCEYLVGFKIGPTDFHFIRRFSNGLWVEKPGGMNLRTMSEEVALSSSWPHNGWDYCTKTHWFAVLNKEI